VSNSLQIFPVSPLPANISRRLLWGENVVEFSAGGQQASTAWAKPLMRWSVPFTNVACGDRESLYRFVQTQRGRLRPFLFKDPDDMHVNSVGIGFTAGVASFYLRDTQSYTIRPDSAALTIWTVDSGALTPGSHFLLDQDTGVVTYVLTPSASDSWSVRSTDFFRKAVFGQDYRDASPRVWSQFSINVAIKELP
jgi:hypothetical protein